MYYNYYMGRFNRIIKDEWTFNPSGGLDIPLASFGPKYDLQGNVVAQTDSEIKNADATRKRVFECLSTYDNLRRLRIRQEGELNGGFSAISTQSRLENATRNAAGRISTNQVSLNGDSDYNDAGSPALAGIDAGEMDDARTYNKRNELTSRTYSDYTGGSPGACTYAAVARRA